MTKDFNFREKVNFALDKNNILYSCYSNSFEHKKGKEGFGDEYTHELHAISLDDLRDRDGNKVDLNPPESAES